MATVEFRYDPKSTAWFTANAAMILKAGEPAYHDTTGLFKLGDGVTALSALSFLPIVSSATPTIQQVLTAGQIATTTIETTGFIKTGGLATEFLKADGTVDSTVYGIGDALTTNPLSQFAATTSAQLAGVISDETGTGALVFGTSPTFTTDITTPLIVGGSAVGSIITYKTTTGVGTAALGHTFVGGTNGNITIATLANNGNTTFGNSQSFIVGLVASSSTYTFSNTVSTTAMTALASTSSTLKTQSGTNSISLVSFSGDVNYINAAGQGLYITTVATKDIFLRPAGASSNVVIFSNSFTTFAPTVVSTGAVTNFTITTSANTNQTATSNIPNFRINGSNKQWATGTVANQYWNYLTANTAAFVGASTMTNSYGLFVEAATAGTNATITNNYAFGTNGRINITEGTAYTIIGQVSSGSSAIWLSTTANTTGYVLKGIGTTNSLNAGTMIFERNSSQVGAYNNSGWQFQPSNNASVHNGLFFITPASVNAIDASAEHPIFKINGISQQWSAGTVGTQRFNWLTANTVSAVGASTFTNVYGLFVEAATAGTNATITNNYAFGTNGKAKFGGNIELTQTVTTEALTSDTSVTIVINGVTYKLLAKA